MYGERAGMRRNWTWPSAGTTSKSVLPVVALAVGLNGLAGEVPVGFFALYEENRSLGIPNYITEDFVAAGYLMALDEAVTEFERNTALPALSELVLHLGDRSTESVWVAASVASEGRHRHGNRS